MQPSTLQQWFLATAVAGAIGNGADRGFCEVFRTVVDRLRAGGRPVNHDLQKAVRKAVVQATLAVCQAHLGELNTHTNLLQRAWHAITSPKAERLWLNKARGELRRELRRLPRADYFTLPSQAEQEIELLLRPKGVTANERAAELRVTLQEALFNELRASVGEPPARFTRFVSVGWDEKGE